MAREASRGTGVRVTGGRYRGLKLETLPGLDLRPTSDKVKEALFSILGARLEGARVVDAFAGTGALGIEALSRGAARVVFVEREPASLAVLRRNLQRVGSPTEAMVVSGDALRPGSWGRDALPAEVILADPPYRHGWPERFLDALVGHATPADGGRLVIEHETAAEPVHEAWEALQRRRYGDTTLSFFRRAAAAPVTGE
jgi:16S rRNA (guanine966-N2)-methyltransferase